jgi:hypothetical protein
LAVSIYGELTLCLAATPAHAVSVTYALDYVFSPATGAVAPLATVVLTDGLSGGAVKFDITNLAGAGTKLDSLYFNFAHGSLNPNQLSFTKVSVSSSTYQTVLAPSTSSTLSSLKADGDGYYDGKFEFTGNNYLAHNQTLSFRLSKAGQTLGVGDFDLFSIPGGGAGTFIMASKIQNLSYGSSVWVGTLVAVPLPGAAILFGTGLAGLARIRLWGLWA